MYSTLCVCARQPPKKNTILQPGRRALQVKDTRKTVACHLHLQYHQPGHGSKSCMHCVFLAGLNPSFTMSYTRAGRRVPPNLGVGCSGVAPGIPLLPITSRLARTRPSHQGQQWHPSAARTGHGSKRVAHGNKQSPKRVGSIARPRGDQTQTPVGVAQAAAAMSPGRHLESSSGPDAIHNAQSATLNPQGSVRKAQSARGVSESDWGGRGGGGGRSA